MITKENTIHDQFYSIAATIASVSKHSGGITVNLTGDTSTRELGYFVGLEGIYAGTFAGLDFHEVADKLEALETLYHGSEVLYFGGWCDQETGLFYLDLTAWVEDKPFALLMGRQYNQVAIWDVAAADEIRL